MWLPDLFEKLSIVVMSKSSDNLSARCSLHDWEGLRSELAFIYDSAIPRGRANLTGDREREFSAWLIREGWVHVESDGVKARAVAGQWVVCSGRRVTQKFAAETRLLSLRVLQSWPDGSPLFGGAAVTVLDGDVFPGLERHARRLLALTERLKWNDNYERDMRTVFHWRNQMDYLTYMDYRRHLQNWQVELAEALASAGRAIHVPEKTDPRLSRALQLLDAHPPGAAYPEGELIRVSGLSIGRLNRVCTQTYGFTTHQYWEKHRLERARLALKAASEPIKQVAYGLGFLQLSHFSAWFKRHEGVSPRAYQALGSR